MGRRQIGLKLVLDQLGLPAQIESFDDRLILQKAIYLAQAAGINLGYYYRWYLRGPYCPSVAEDGFALSAEISQGVDDALSWRLDAGSAGKLTGIRRMLEGATRQDLARKLELLASVHFLISRKQVPSHDASTVSQALRRFNKVFTEKEVAQAIKEMKDARLLS